MACTVHDAQKEFSEAVGDVRLWCEDEYRRVFSKYFEGVPDLYDKVSTSRSKLSDDDVEWVLADLPLQLIAVSEELSQYKLNIECLKLFIKQKEAEFAQQSDKKSVSARREEATLKVSEYNMLLKAYSCVYSRVDNQINFARELVMSCKKIWDSRRKVYCANPVSPLDLDSYSSSTFNGKDA